MAIGGIDENGTDGVRAVIQTDDIDYAFYAHFLQLFDFGLVHLSENHRRSQACAEKRGVDAAIMMF